MRNAILVIDTETGGFDPHEHSLLTLAAVVWQDGSILARKHLQIAEPEIVAEEEALKVNNINLDRHRSTAATPSRAVDDLEHFLSNFFSPRQRITLAGHNVWFDAAFLQRLYRLAERDYRSRFSHRYIDTATIMEFLSLAGVVDIERSSLDEAISYFNMPSEAKARHTALGDAEITCEVLVRLLELVQQRSARI